MDDMMEGELHETMEWLREMIGEMPDTMFERLFAQMISTLTSQQETGTSSGERSAWTPASEQ